ncbi:unnamed protein product [Parascedosporium putredinis]|uniref:Uncharacterized protein n=1 Tax=Parascedosporium putredinis TaxID=1442378 RepID=A0A9P1HBR3_9PEZI|nr:unnamed protein product [Parascedosporium putredinis]CAI8004143.1 unnamed protein product [Parascedosporium putredinis]
MPPAPLPTHRELLTALTEALATSTRGLPTRHIISTLHVLFPSLLLPALDLLDRDLVRRVVVVAASTPVRGRNDDDDDGGSGTEEDDRTVEKDVEQAREGTYIVRSLVSTMGGKRRAQAKSYLVLLTAWSCTCPAFIFDALPARTTSTPSSNAPPSAHPFRSSPAAPATAGPASASADGAPRGTGQMVLWRLESGWLTWERRPGPLLQTLACVRAGREVG